MINAHLTYADGETKIDITLPKNKTDDAIKVLQAIVRPKKHHEQEMETPDWLRWYERRCSKEFLEQKGVENLIAKVKEKNCLYLSHGFPLSVAVTQHKEDLKAQLEPDRKQWKASLSTMLDEVHRDHIEQVAVHIGGGGNDLFRQQLAEQVRQGLPLVPVRVFYSKKNTNELKAELLLFSSQELRKDPFPDFLGDL